MQNKAMTQGGKITRVLVCIDQVYAEVIAGSYYTHYTKQAQPFVGFGSLLLQLDQFFDDIGCPQATTERRSFITHSPARREKECFDLETTHDIVTVKGHVASFEIWVRYRHHSSWQGTVSWIEKDSTRQFRSCIELIHCINSALFPDSESLDFRKKTPAYLQEERCAFHQNANDIYSEDF